MVVENSGARRSRHCGNGGRSARTDLGETEVENLGLAAGGHKNIGWLDVAVDDAFGVRGVQRVGHLAPRSRSKSSGRGRPAMRSRRVWPSRYSMTRKLRPADSPMS